MNKSFLFFFLTVLVIGSLIVAGILLVNLSEDEVLLGELYKFPVLVGEKTYIITVRTNWTSAVEVYLPGIPINYVSVDFRGPLRANVFFNVTIPADLIWGEISVIWKYYEQSDDRYNLCYNATHHSVHMTFYHTAVVEHFEIRGTEGVMTEFP